MARKTAERQRVRVVDEAPEPTRDRAGTGAETRRQLLDAAEACLREHGYSGLSTRKVTMAAGVPLSQLHYHFGSKQGLVLALFEDLNNRLLERQTAMFTSDLPLWRQWELACDYLDEDLESGYVRILNELAAAGWSDKMIGNAVRKAMAGWKELLTDVATRAGERFGGVGPLAPEDIAALVTSVFLGAEMNILSGHENSMHPVRRALRRFGGLIRDFEIAATGGE